MGEGVPFRFEIPNRVWATEEGEPLEDVLLDPDAFIEISEEAGPFERDVSVLVGRCHRQVLAELGPIVEALHRAPDA